MERDGTASDRARVLVVEDDREMQHLLRSVLSSEAREVIVVGTGEEAETVLLEGTVDLVILDLMLPDCDGRTLLPRIRTDPATAHVPVICVSSQLGPEITADCYAKGADSFVEKPFDPEVLLSDVTQRLERRVERVADTTRDDLTGLLNRVGLLGALPTLSESDLAFVDIEMDGFRPIVARCGWEVGNDAVSKMAQAIAEVAGKESLVARWAGSEFLIALRGESLSGAELMAARMLDAVRDVTVRGSDGETFRLTASAGVARGEGVDDPGALIELAEERLFRARHAGGNRVLGDDAEDTVRSKTILVAEDDDLAATILLHRLGKEGFEVRRFADGLEAYEGALDVAADLMILDVRMPGMDGFELLTRLRRSPAHVNVPIIMLTSVGNEADVVRAFELGVDDYVLKPFSPTELTARVRRLLARGRPASSE